MGKKHEMLIVRCEENGFFDLVAFQMEAEDVV